MESTLLTVTVINCGRGGLHFEPHRFSEYLRSIGDPDIVVFTETHLRPASAPALDQYAFLWEPRSPSKLQGNSSGGVAFAISRESRSIKRAEVIHAHTNSDIVWLQVSLNTSPVVVHIAGVYFPPEGGNRVCHGNCIVHLCKKAHVGEAIENLSIDIQRYNRLGPVIIAGDFNVRAQDSTYPRWIAVQQSIITPRQLAVLNPLLPDGSLQPTRFDPPTRTQSVLDLVMWTGSQQRASCVIDTVAAISDHYPMQCSFKFDPHPSSSSDHSTQLYAKSYGLQSNIPSHLRGSHKAVSPQPATGRQQFADIITNTWDAAISDTTTIGDIERWLMTRSEECGLVAKRARTPIELKAAAKAQRSVDALRLQYHFAIAGNASQHRLSLISNQLQSAIDIRNGLQQSRRCQQRLRRQKKRKDRASVVDNLCEPWCHRNPQTFARRARVHELGNVRFKSTRNHTPLHVLQSTLHQLQLDLAVKYSRDFDPALEQRWRQTLADDIANGYAHDTQYVPTPEEVQRALGRMKAGADAIGLPVKVLKATVGTPAFATIVSRIQDMWRTGVTPDSFQLSRVHLIHKAGPHHLLASHRTIGICSAMSRLLQTTIESKLMMEVAPKICPAQYGFMRGRATELCVFVAQSATFCARADGATVECVKLDIKGAFPTTRHTHIHAALRAYKVSVGIRRLLIGWYAHQRLFLQLGRLVSDIVWQWLGVTEGAVFSPIVYNIVIDPSLQRTHSLYLWANIRLTVKIGISVLGLCVVVLFYADDGNLLHIRPPAMQLSLDVLGGDFAALDYEFNAAVNKSAVMRWLPIDKAAKRAARQQPPPVYMLCDKELPQTDRYKYLGVHEHTQSVNKSRSLHNQSLSSVLATFQRQAASSDMTALPLIHCRQIYMTYWWPRVMYAAGLVQTSVPKSFEVTESRVLRYFTSAWQHPAVALRSVFGIPTQQTRLDLDRIRLFFRLLSQPAASVERACLSLLVCQYTRDHNQQSWWHRTREVFATMDAVTQQPHAPNRLVSVGAFWRWDSWVDWATQQAADSDRDLRTELAVLYPVCRNVMLDVECHRRQQDILTNVASLGEVAGLLDTPNIAPFTCLKRSKSTTARVQLWGGRRTLFGYEHFHFGACPHCRLPGGFTVAHIFRDCARLENERRIAYSEAVVFLKSHGVKRVSAVDDNREQWYRLTVGASVDDAVFSLRLSTSTHFARPKLQAATRHLRENLSVYRGVMRKLDAFFLKAVESTLVELILWRDVMLFTPPTGIRLPRVNHAIVPQFTNVFAPAPQAPIAFPTPGLQQYIDWYNTVIPLVGNEGNNVIGEAEGDEGTDEPNW